MINNRRQPRDLVVIGGSAGALEGLDDLLPRLPPDLPATLVITVHMSPSYRSRLSELLGRSSRLPVVPAVHGQAVAPGHVYVSVPDRHVIVTPTGLALTRGPREHFTRPAIDPLFRSAADAYGERVVGVLLSGSGQDGTLGLVAIKRAGGITLVLDPKSTPYKKMPTFAIDNADVDRVMVVGQIADALDRLARGHALPENSRHPGEMAASDDD